MLEAPMQDNKTVIAFGSCYGIFNQKGDIFKYVNEEEPALWAWIGDAAYADETHLSGCKYRFVKSFTVVNDNSNEIEIVKERF